MERSPVETMTKVLSSAIAAAGLVLSASPSAATPASETVVLLHGLGRGPWSMKILELRLEREGYRVHSLTYNDRADSIEEAATFVHTQLESCCADAAALHFVTHSLGGLVLRSLFQNHAVPNAGKAVLLAPPNAGTQIVDRFAELRLFAWVMGPLAPQLGTGPEQLPKSLPTLPIPFGVIAGNRGGNPLGALFLAEPSDGTVTIESTRLPGMLDHLVVPNTHSFLMNSSEVAKAVSLFLAAGHFPRLSGDPQ